MPSLDQTLIAAIRAAGVEGAAIADLIRHLDTGTDDSIRKRASELTLQGVLERHKRGWYRIPGLLNPNVVSEAVVAYPDRSVAPPSRAEAFVESLQDMVTFDLLPSVSAGSNPLIYDERSRISVTLPRPFVRQFLGFDPPALMGVSEVEGDSMWPTLMDGDLVLYDLSPDFSRTGLYVVMYEGRQICKRLQPAGKGYRIISENRLAGYATEILRWTEDGYVLADTGDMVEFGIVGVILFPRPETARIQTEHLAHLLKQMFSEAATGS